MRKVVVLTIVFVLINTIGCFASEKDVYEVFYSQEQWERMKAIPESQHVSCHVTDGIAYIRIPYFHSLVYEQTKTILDELREKDVHKIILDLRDNHGGLLEETINVAALLIPEGSVCTLNLEGEEPMTFYSALKEPEFEILVLADALTASAAELLASAIQESGAGKVVGCGTYGKSSIQFVKPAESGGAHKATVGRFLTREGHDINGVGVLPDYIMLESDEAYWNGSVETGLWQRFMEPLS